MPLLLVLLALFLPRLVLVLLWLFTHWLEGIFTHWIIPVLGFLFLPYTLLWYAAVYRWFDAEWGVLQIVILIVALVADVGITGSHRKKSE